MLRSYYEILNVSPYATKDEIKKQFKKLAKMYHPDINSSLEAEIRFKEINKASEILLDDNKRREYDRLRAISNNFKNNSSNYSYNDLFKKKDTKKSSKSYTKEEIKPINGEDITVNIKIDYSEALLGTYRIVNIVHSEICPKCKGHKFANEQKCPICKGAGELSKNRKITVKIPSGIKNNSKLRLKGEGNTGKFGGKNGNLYVIIEVEQKHENLSIVDGIVYYNAQISPYKAILGGDVTVETLWGEATIKIPPLTKTFQSFKLVNVGVLDEKTNKKGDEIVKIVVQIPTSITDEEYKLYEKLEEINSKKKNATAINT